MEQLNNSNNFLSHLFVSTTVERKNINHRRCVCVSQAASVDEDDGHGADAADPQACKTWSNYQELPSARLLCSATYSTEEHEPCRWLHKVVQHAA
jgi:hypothetical protein